MPLVFLGVLCLITACGRDDLLNRKHVATVNGEKIYLDEYRERLNTQKELLSPKAFPYSSDKREVLELSLIHI